MPVSALLLTDGSEHSLEAARWLARHAAELRDPPRIHLLHVHPPLPYPRAADVVGRATVETYQREMSDEALAPASGILTQAGIRFQKSWTVGDVAPSIAEYARVGKFDLVVMGTHGHGALLNLALGSVATKCIATLRLPVVVVPHPG